MRYDEGAQPRVLLCTCGGIAAYKAVEALRGLQRAGCAVRVASTADGLRFVGAATWEGLTHTPVAHDLYAYPASAIPHVDLAGWADAVLVMPATANLMAKIAHGLADDLVSAALLAVPAATPVVVAPAMNVHMWQAAATQANVATLRARGARMVMPVEGHLACDAIGEGKLAPVDDIVAAVLDALGEREGEGAPGDFREKGERDVADERSEHGEQHGQSVTAGCGEQPVAGETSLPDAAGAALSADKSPRADGSSTLAGCHVLVTAGPTHEAIDPVRYLANASSGKMGFALAAEAARRGARVTLVAGPVALATPAGVERVDVVSAAEMHAAAVAAFVSADVAICAAAVADYTPAHPADHKLKKSSEPLDEIRLVQTADILAELGARKHEGGRTRVVVGFAAETHDLIANARAKLEHKGCDLVVANDVSRSDSGFGTDTNRVSLVSAEGVCELPTLPKAEVAAQVLAWVAELWMRQGGQSRMAHLKVRHSGTVPPGAPTTGNRPIEPATGDCPILASEASQKGLSPAAGAQERPGPSVGNTRAPAARISERRAAGATDISPSPDATQKAPSPSQQSLPNGDCPILASNASQKGLSPLAGPNEASQKGLSPVAGPTETAHLLPSPAAGERSPHA